MLHIPPAVSAPPGDIAAWIVEAGLNDLPVPDLAEGVVLRLRAGGVPIDRLHIAFRVHHPLFDGMSVTWTTERGVAPDLETFKDIDGMEDYLRSPFYHMLSNDLTECRLRLAHGSGHDGFPLLTQLRAQGHTDYLAALIVFGGAALHPGTHDGIGTSWSTRARCGFSDADLAAIRRTLGPLGLALRVAIKDQITRTALDTFHGPLVGRRILSGAIKRGAGERIHAALWYSDLRNSTGLADALPTEPFLALLNAYCECTAGAVMDQGGQVLDIIGDAVLAIFPAEGGADGRSACAQALAAATDAQFRLAALKHGALTGSLSNGATSSPLPLAGEGQGGGPSTAAAPGRMDARDKPGHDDVGARSNPAHALAFGIGVHYGDVVFGNAGTPDRLKFGVIGRAVNEVARTADMAKSLKRGIVVSDAAANRATMQLDDLGLHELRGIPTARRLWGLDFPGRTGPLLPLAP